MTFRELLTQKVDLSAAQLDALEHHYVLLMHWNAKINLTRIRDAEEAVSLHYWESVLLAQALPVGPLAIADVGSGGGFPGIPLAIVRPECRVTLIESHRRKAVFLRQASRNLANVRVIDDRAESVQERFDWVIARAVAPRDVLGLPIAENFAILMSEDLTGLQGPLSVSKLPGGNQRVLAMFHVKHYGT